MDNPLREVPAWVEDYWEDWYNEHTDDGRRRVLEGHGVPPELLSEKERLFPSCDSPKKKRRRPWTRGEKLTFAAIIVAIVFGVPAYIVLFV